MRPAADLPLDNTEILTYDLLENKQDLNDHPQDPNYSYCTPEGTGGEVKLPADPSNVPAQTRK